MNALNRKCKHKITIIDQFLKKAHVLVLIVLPGSRFLRVEDVCNYDCRFALLCSSRYTSCNALVQVIHFQTSFTITMAQYHMILGSFEITFKGIKNVIFSIN